jgi:hypothetical protein
MLPLPYSGVRRLAARRKTVIITALDAANNLRVRMLVNF